MVFYLASYIETVIERPNMCVFAHVLGGGAEECGDVTAAILPPAVLP